MAGGLSAPDALQQLMAHAPHPEWLWQAYRPQMNDYVTRALDPAAAPGYGVPGDPGR
jgi:hypothetical protein